MYGRLTRTRARFRSELSAEQLRGVRILGVLSIIVLVGLAVTGIWQLFGHRSDPTWFEHVVGSGNRRTPTDSTGVAGIHGLFSTLSGLLVLLGGGYYAYKIIQDVSWIAVLALGAVIFGSVTGSLMRFNAAVLVGRDYGDTGPGYWQFFHNRVEVVVTDKFDIGATAIRLLTLSHVLVLPMLLAVAWFSMQPARVPARSGHSSPGGPPGT